MSLSPGAGRASRRLLLAYITLALLSVLPATGLYFNSSTLFLGIPVSIFWLGSGFVALAALTGVGYLSVFRPWSARIDAPAGETEQRDE